MGLWTTAQTHRRQTHDKPYLYRSCLAADYKHLGGCATELKALLVSKLRALPLHFDVAFSIRRMLASRRSHPEP